MNTVRGSVTQQQMVVSNGAGRVVLAHGLVPGSTPPQWGLALYRTGHLIGFIGQNTGRTTTRTTLTHPTGGVPTTGLQFLRGSTAGRHVLIDTRGIVTPPVFAETIFNYVGTVAVGASPPWSSRRTTNIVAVRANLGTFGTKLTFELKVGTTVVKTVTMAAKDLLPLAVTPVKPIKAYKTLVSIDVTSAGTGNANLVVYVQMA